MTADTQERNGPMTRPTYRRMSHPDLGTIYRTSDGSTFTEEWQAQLYADPEPEPERETRDPSAADRLPAALAGRLEDLRAILARDDMDEGDDELPPLSEYGLGSDIRYSIRVDLSTGGPADYVTATVAHGDVLEAEYHFADWFDHSSRKLDGEDFETIERWLGALFDLDSLGEYVSK